MTGPDTIASAAFRPSAYTALVLKQLLQRRARLQGASVLDIGCGSGVLLAGAGRLGAGALCGVDIEPAAVAATRTQLTGAGTGSTATRIEALHLSQMTEQFRDLLDATTDASSDDAVARLVPEG